MQIRDHDDKTGVMPTSLLFNLCGLSEGGNTQNGQKKVCRQFSAHASCTVPPDEADKYPAIKSSHFQPLF
jgi:hypothetical protein